MYRQYLLLLLVIQAAVTIAKQLPTTPPPPPADQDTLRPRARSWGPGGAGGGWGEKVRMCYFANWATHEAGKGRFTPNDIDPSLCTHILYAYAHISRDCTNLETTHPQDVEFYRQIVALKRWNPALKVLLSVGGAGLQQSERFTLMASTISMRVSFIENAVLYLKRYGFDGLDLSWLFPVSDTREHFQLLVGELGLALENEAQETWQPKRLLTVAVWGNAGAIESSYGPEDIVESVDYFLLMTYNLWGMGLPKLGHHTSLYVRPEDAWDPLLSSFSVNKTVETWVRQGVRRDKIVMGLASFGMTTRLRDQYQSNIGDPHLRSPSTPGPLTADGTSLAYVEICQNIGPMSDKQWTSRYIAVTEGAIAYSTRYPYDWVCYDNPQSFRAKARYALEEDLAGVFVWSMDYDDFGNEFCNQGRYPLLTAVKEVFEGIDTPTTTTTSPVWDTTTTRSTTTRRYPPPHRVTTPHPGRPTQPCVEFRCPPENESNPYHLHPNPFHCDRYYQCSNFYPYDMACPAGLVFNPNVQRCDYDYNYSCVPCP